MPMEGDIVIRAERLSKRYRSGAEELVVFDGLELEIRRGERLAVIGACVPAVRGKATIIAETTTDMTTANESAGPLRAKLWCFLVLTTRPQNEVSRRKTLR